MKFGACAKERELTELLDRGHWPEASSNELREHVAACPRCRDLLLVRKAFVADRAHMAGSARLESPGVLWWRAQLGRRHAAIERIGRPILGAQIFALATTVAAAVLYIAIQTRRGFGWLAWVEQLPRALHLEAFVPDGLTRYEGETWLVVSLVAMLALMSGVIVYLSSEKR